MLGTSIEELMSPTVISMQTAGGGVRDLYRGTVNSDEEEGGGGREH